MNRSHVYLAVAGPDRGHHGAVTFLAPEFTLAGLRMAYRMARRTADPTAARIIVVTAFAAGLGGVNTVSGGFVGAGVPIRPTLHLLTGGG